MDGINDCLHASIASILESIGFRTVDKQSFILLCRLAANFGNDTKRLTENANRSISNLTDAKYALLLKNINIYEVPCVQIRPCPPVKIPSELPKQAQKPLQSGVYCYEDVVSGLLRLTGLQLPPVPEPHTMMSTPCLRPGKPTAEEMRKQSAERARQLEEAYARILLAQVSDERAPISLFTGNTEFMLPVVPIRSRVYLDALLRGAGYDISSSDTVASSTAAGQDQDPSNMTYSDQSFTDPQATSSDPSGDLQTIFLKKPSFPQL